MESRFSFASCLQRLTASLGIPLEKEVLTGLDEYFHLLLKARERQNLIGRLTEEDICSTLFADSLLGLKMLSEGEKKVIDVGSGAGFPGMPLKIACPGLHMTFLDAMQKKVDFIRLVAEYLHLENVTFVQERAEILGRNPEFRETFDIAVAKGFAPLPQLVELCAPLIKEGGKIVAWKGIHYDEEINMLGNAYSLLGLSQPQCMDFTIDRDVKTILVHFDKIAATPERFPRSYQAIRKRPLSSMQ